MKKTITIAICLVTVGLVSNAQSTSQKDKYGYNSKDSRFNKPVTSTTTSSSSTTTTTTNSNTSRSTTSSPSSPSTGNAPSADNSTPWSPTTYPAITEKKDPPIKATKTTVQPLEPGKVRKAQ